MAAVSRLFIGCFRTGNRPVQLENAAKHTQPGSKRYGKDRLEETDGQATAGCSRGLSGKRIWNSDPLFSSLRTWI